MPARASRVVAVPLFWWNVNTYSSPALTNRVAARASPGNTTRVKYDEKHYVVQTSVYRSFPSFLFSVFLPSFLLPFSFLSFFQLDDISYTCLKQNVQVNQIITITKQSFILQSVRGYIFYWLELWNFIFGTLFEIAVNKIINVIFICNISN